MSTELHDGFRNPEENSAPVDPSWSLHVTLAPTSDGKYCRISIELRKPSSRLPIYINSAGSTDLLYEKTQGELNNALRQLMNDITDKVIRPNKRTNKHS